MEPLLLKKFIQNFIFIHLIAQTSSLSCNLKLFNNNWLNDWHLLLKQHGNGRYQLLREREVPVNTEILVVCNNRRNPTAVSCNDRRRFTVPLPLREACTATQSLMPVRNEETVTSCPYKLYRFGFNIEINGRSQFLETYKVCFDRIHMRPLYTINMAYPHAGKRPPGDFDPDDIFTPRYFSAFNAREIIKRFRKLLGSSQAYMEESNVEHIINRGHLTPSADFSLTNLKRSTFSLINAVPEFKTIDSGNWNKIEEWARLTPSKVCNGVLDCNLDSANVADINCVVKLQDQRRNWVAMFLADDRKIPIPLWLYKIVKNKDNSWVFLILNNIYHEGNVAVPRHICEPLECPNVGLDQTVAAGRTFCCDYNDFINRNVPYLKNEC